MVKSNDALIFSDAQNRLLSLLQNSLFNKPITAQAPGTAEEWKELLHLASRQSVTSLIFKSLNCGSWSSESYQPFSMDLLKTSVIIVLHSERVAEVQANALQILRNAGIGAVVHKGFSVAVNYPDINMRPQGDIDLLVDKVDYDRAVQALIAAGALLFEGEYPYHQVVGYHGVTIEIHCAVARKPLGIAGEYFESFMSTAVRDARQISVEGMTFSIMNPCHQAVALLMHMQKHMVIQGISLRQLCDWMMFVHKNLDIKTWDSLKPVLDKIGLTKYAQVLTKTCELYLGLPETKWAKADQSLCAELIMDFLEYREGGRTGIERTAGNPLMEDIGHIHITRRSWIGKTYGQFRSLAIRKFTICNKFRIFIPFIILYMILRYYVKLTKKSDEISIIGVIKAASRRQKLYDALHFFQPGK